MIAAGYMWKGDLSKPEGFLEDSHVEKICSVSSCMARNFSYDQGSWNHNGFWMYDSIAKMQAEADHGGIETGSLTCFYYEVYEKQFVEEGKVWEKFKSNDLPTDVQPPDEKTLLGYDVVTFSTGTSPECSPLSCNYRASIVEVNKYCLIPTFEAAKSALEAGVFDLTEPGPFRIFGVYSCSQIL